MFETRVVKSSALKVEAGCKVLTAVFGPTFVKVVNAVLGKRLVRAAPGGKVVIRVGLKSARLVKAAGKVVLEDVLRIDVLLVGPVVGHLARLVKLVKRVGRIVLRTKVLAAGTVVGKPEEAEVLGRLVTGKLPLGVLD